MQELTRERKDELSMHFFIVQKDTLEPKIPIENQEVRAIIAYTENDAFKLIKEMYPPGYFVIKKSSETIEKLISGLGVIDAMTRTEEKPKKKTKKQFINELSLVVDKYVKEKRDQTTLKRIIKKI